MGRAPVTSPAPSKVEPVLRAPPFPGYPRDLQVDTSTFGTTPLMDQSTLFTALRQAQVGGTFWGRRWNFDASRAPITIDRTRAPQERVSSDTANIPFAGASEAIDPWSVLGKARQLRAPGHDEWIVLASVFGLEIEVISPGQFGDPGDAAEVLAQRAYDALNRPFPDPFGDGVLDPVQAITLLAEWRRVIVSNRGKPGERIAAATGMSWWKRQEIRQFLWSPGAPVSIHLSAKRAVKTAAKKGGALAVWPSRISPNLERQAKAKGVNLVRVEDGFVRSVGLGSNLVPPLSVIVDREGIHYDPSRPSDLETILAKTDFPAETIERAAHLRTQIVSNRISKYAAGSKEPAQTAIRPQGIKRVVLVCGQVEDDMSVLSGGGGLTSNLELLRRTRSLEPEAEIWWRPHPDVDAGHRTGAVDDNKALQHAERIVREGTMSDLLDQVDALHTITSLSGFEALLRGCEVTCHGVPFYSGWGLTHDLGSIPERRRRLLSLDELVAGVLLIYPRYLDPESNLPCPPEMLIARLAHGTVRNRLNWVEPLRRLQGRVTRRWRGERRQ